MQPKLYTLYYMFIPVGLKTIGGVFPVWVLVLIIGLALSTLVFCTSRNDVQPKYHAVSSLHVPDGNTITYS